MQNRASVASLVAAGSVLLGPILASTAAASRYQLTRVNSGELKWLTARDL